jgi:hypothetical protein
MTNNFTYVSQPHSAPKLLSQTAPSRMVPLTLMSDPRVIRGNTHSTAKKISKGRTEEEESNRKQAETLTQQEGKSGDGNSFAFTSNSMAYYRFDPKPFSEKDINMSKYLIEDEHVIVKKHDIDTQADDFLPMPAPTPFVPLKSGIDKCTQVDDTNELFHFDLEVIPMLEVIVRKTLEQALMEVSTEFEIANLQDEIENFEKQKEVERNWIQQQETDLRADLEKKMKFKEERKQMKEQERMMKNKVAGLQMVRQVFPNLIESAFRDNIATGTWINLEREIPNSLLQEQLKNRVETFARNYFDTQILVNGELSFSFPFYSSIFFFTICFSSFRSLELLQEADAQFQQIPAYKKPNRTKTVLFCTFAGKSSNNEAADDGENPAAVAVSEIVVRMELTSEDTIQTITKRIKVFFIKRNL